MMFWVLWCIALIFATLAAILLAIGWPNSQTHAGRTRHRSATSDGSSGDVEGASRLFGDDPVKAVYVGYAAGISSIDTTVRAAVDAGFNLIILAFYMGPATGADPFSAAYYWNLLPDATKSQVMAFAHDNGAKVIVSAGGAGYTAYPADGAAAFGQGAAQFAQTNHLDGVDFDFENFTTAFGTPSGLNKAQTIQWLNDATNTARTTLGEAAWISHAPQSPYFNVEFAYGYLEFMLQDPEPSVDSLLIQLYNQGAGAYQTYDMQFIDNDTFHPGTAVAQLITSGIPASQIVLGKLTQPNDGDPATWTDPAILGQWFAQAATDARTHNWRTGISTWQWHQQNDGTPSSAQFLAAVYTS